MMKNTVYVSFLLVFVASLGFAQGFTTDKTWGTGLNTKVGVGTNVDPSFTGELLLALTNEGGAFEVPFVGDCPSSAAVILDSQLSVPASSVWYGTFETLGVKVGGAGFFWESQPAAITYTGSTLSISLGSATNASATIGACTVTPKVNNTTKKVYVEVTGIDSNDITFVGSFRGKRLSLP